MTFPRQAVQVADRMREIVHFSGTEFPHPDNKPGIEPDV